MDIQGIQKIVQRGLFSLADSLNSYWPPYGKKGIAERNLTMHVGSELLNNGFDVYAEISLAREEQGKKLDTLAVSHQHKLYIAIESKKLNSAKKAAEVIADIKRIQQFSLRHHDLEMETSYGLILAETWDPDISAWWIAEQPEDVNGDTIWGELGNTFDQLREFEKGSVTLYHNSIENDEVHKALYVLWEMPIRAHR